MAATDGEVGHPTSIPALLARNARVYAAQPAWREKEFGIWQVWTWAEGAAEIRAIALGLMALGLERGDHVAVIGRNRPALYWSMIAAQMVAVFDDLDVRAVKLGMVGDAAAIAAHYGSVSAVTFIAATNYLKSIGQPYESYAIAFLAVAPENWMQLLEQARQPLLLT